MRTPAAGTKSCRAYVAQRVKVPAEDWASYDWQGRAVTRHRAEIRTAFGFRESAEEDQESWRSG
ncbi:DUF4158 domain-containing protein [Streptomyces sp. J2-1]|uniref:DUF4158 domain-containing protein n=1 Tax=Streptomyces corallincola TaxID=2851888 RepID=UPI001C395623|nr:DUF4158 domain-containing protein [Streptomyces corallincola]